jgi:VIT1/CCC1 family predicted Fe2+/Mn2+ transporter
MMSSRYRTVVRAYLPDNAYGANDGIVTTLVMIASVKDAAMSTTAIIVLGTPNLLADGFSMGTSIVLSIRSIVTAAARPSLANASRNGFATFVAFILAGLLPISGYLLPFEEPVRFPIAAALAVAAQFGIGVPFAFLRAFMAGCRPRDAHLRSCRKHRCLPSEPSLQN